MLKKSLIEIFTRDLNKLKTEIALYEDEAEMWLVKGSAPNSAGNLCLHLIGNINHFFGAVLDKNGYERRRDAEFADQNVPRTELSQKIDETIKVLQTTFENLSDEDFEKDYPEQFQNRSVKTIAMILHLSTHLNYHLGQINYHRRLITF